MEKSTTAISFRQWRESECLCAERYQSNSVVSLAPQRNTYEGIHFTDRFMRLVLLITARLLLSLVAV